MNLDSIAAAYDAARAAYHAYRAAPEARVARRRKARQQWILREAELRKVGGTAEVVRQMLVERCQTTLKTKRRQR